MLKVEHISFNTAIDHTLNSSSDQSVIAAPHTSYKRHTETKNAANLLPMSPVKQRQNYFENDKRLAVSEDINDELEESSLKPCGTELDF